MRFHEYEAIITGAKRIARELGLKAPTTEDVQDILDSRIASLDQARTVLLQQQIAVSATDEVESSTSTLREPKDAHAYAEISIMRLHHEFDRSWQSARRPYYRVYPSIIPMLTKLNLEKVRGSNITMPNGLLSLSLQFPVSHPLGGEVRTLWVSLVRLDEAFHGTTRGLSIGIDHGEIFDRGPIYLIRCFPLKDMTLEECLAELPEGASAKEGKLLDPEIVADCIRLACTVCLIGENPELVQPDVLSKDLGKVTDENLDRLVEKARRRGKLGWSLGRSIETIPHFRRPHPALVWTGVGRTIPKIIRRSGCVVHRDVVAAVPTGYGDDDEKQVLP